jgi:hypothetical protein
MALFCQVKEGTLLEDFSVHISDLATKVTKSYSVFDLFDSQMVNVNIMLQCSHAVPSLSFTWR